MIDRRAVAEHLRGCGEASLVIDDGVGVENVLLVLILDMDEGVAGRDTFPEGFRENRFSLGAAIGVRGRGKIALAKRFARERGVVADRTAKADSIGAWR